MWSCKAGMRPPCPFVWRSIAWECFVCSANSRGKSWSTSAKRRCAWTSELRGPDVCFQYRLIDMRELDGDRLIESEEVGDNVIAILARLRDHREAVQKIVGKIASLAAAEREAALSRLLILAGLRRLEETVAREIQKMPVYIDILENKVLGPPYKKGLEEGRQEGRQESRQEGLREGERKGELAILRRLIEKRFGAIPSSGRAAPRRPLDRRIGRPERPRAGRPEHRRPSAVMQPSPPAACRPAGESGQSVESCPARRSVPGANSGARQ